MKRAIRRHHRERLKKKRKCYYNGWAGISPSNIGKMVNTPKTCSCSGCGNPRNHKCKNKEKLTIQERKACEGDKYYEYI